MTEQQDLVNVLANARNKAITLVDAGLTVLLINEGLLQIYGVLVHKPIKYTPAQRAKHIQDLYFKMLYFPIGKYVKPSPAKETPVIKIRSWLNKVLRRM